MPSLAPERFRELRRGRLGEPYVHVELCDSTQELLRDPSLPEGAVAVAEHQLAGRGRQGRRWEDIPGRSLLCSILLRPASGPLAQLSLVVALAAAEAIEAASGLRAELKWPNDVLLGGGKVAGILLEAVADGVVAGVGVNVDQDAGELPAGARRPATSLRIATGLTHDRGELLASLLVTLERRYRSWQADGLGSLRPDLDARSFLRGRPVSAGTHRGVAGGIAAGGGLEVLLDSGGTLVVESGEVELLP